MTTARRYPLEPLFEAMRMTPHAACVWLGCSGSTELEYRQRGVTDRVADRLAVKAGFHPFEIWPELAEHRHVEIQKACIECGQLFLPGRSTQKYCTRACGRRYTDREWQKRRYRENPSYKAAKQAAWREHYAQHREYERKRRMRHYYAQKTRGFDSGDAQSLCAPLSTNSDGEVAS